jgi:hypothetical protein
MILLQAAIGLGMILVFIVGGIIVFGIPLFTAALMSLLLWQSRRKKIIDARPWPKALVFTVSLFGAIALAALVIFLVFEFLPDNLLDVS